MRITVQDLEISEPRRKKLRKEVKTAVKRLQQIYDPDPTVGSDAPKESADELDDSDMELVIPEEMANRWLYDPSSPTPHSDDETVLLINAPAGSFEELLSSSNL